MKCHVWVEDTIAKNKYYCEVLIVGGAIAGEYGIFLDNSINKRSVAEMKSSSDFQKNLVMGKKLSILQTQHSKQKKKSVKIINDTTTSSSDVSSSSSSSRDISSLIGRKLESKVKDLRGLLDFHGVRISNIVKIQIEHEKRITKVEKVMDTLGSRTLNMEDGINTLLGRDHISIRQSTGRGRGAKNYHNSKNCNSRAAGSEKSDTESNVQSNQTVRRNSKRKQNDKINYDEEYENADEEDNSTNNRENKRRNESTNRNKQSKNNNQNQKSSETPTDVMDQQSESTQIKKRSTKKTAKVNQPPEEVTVTASVHESTQSNNQYHQRYTNAEFLPKVQSTPIPTIKTNLIPTLTDFDENTAQKYKAALQMNPELAEQFLNSLHETFGAAKQQSMPINSANTPQ